MNEAQPASGTPPTVPEPRAAFVFILITGAIVALRATSRA
jgi:hypothetical protein